MLYFRVFLLCCKALLNMFFPGHVPGKNTLTREHFRRNAAKPGPQAGAKLSKASQR